jgi:hypothetical protein
LQLGAKYHSPHGRVLPRWLMYYWTLKIRNLHAKLDIPAGSEKRSPRFPGCAIVAQYCPYESTKVNRVVVGGYIMVRCSPFKLASSYCRVPGYWRPNPSTLRRVSGRASAVLPARDLPWRIGSAARGNNSYRSGPFGLAASPEGKSVLTANGGPGRNSSPSGAR